MNLADLSALNDAVGKVRVNPKALGRLIHLEVDPSSFQPIKSIIGSDLIAENIAQQICSKKAEDVMHPCQSLTLREESKMRVGQKAPCEAKPR